MQRQKTIAKWLGIILLVTIIAGCYILVKTFGTDNKTNPNPVADSSNDDDPPDEPHVPYYSVLPRAAETVSGLSVAHIGGEGDDTLLGSANIGYRKFVFFNSSSVEYDVKANGMHIAIFENGSLLKTMRFASSGETFVFCKITYQGLIAATQTQNGVKLYLFSTDTGTLSAQTDMDNIKNPYCYIASRTAWLFAFENQTLRAYKLGDGLSAAKSAYLYSVDSMSSDISIAQAFPLNGATALVLDDFSNKVRFVTFDETSGFSFKNEYLNCGFLQMGSISSDSATTYFTLMKHTSGFVITAHDASLKTMYQTVLSNTPFALIFIEDAEVHAVTQNTLTRFCKHLDVLGQANLQTDFSSVSNALDSSAKKTFLAVNGASKDLYCYSKGTLSKLASFLNNDGIWFTGASPSAVEVCFTSVSNSGICHMNFGGSDAFFVSVPV
jgi:hypothetical protein